jgi:O-acetyl-ADP-ribose deacetylase
VAGINMLWRSSEGSIRGSVRSALALAAEHGYRSIAFPVIGAGSGGMGEERARALLLDELDRASFEGEIRVVVFKG